MCYKCSNYSPHLHGNVCTNCNQEYVFSFVSFEILPLSEFMIEPDITAKEAERLLLTPPKANENIDQLTDTMINEVKYY